MTRPEPIRGNAAERNLDHLYNLLIHDLRDYAVFTISLEGRITSWNIGVQRILGYTEHEFLDQSFSTLFASDDVAAGIPVAELKRASLTGHSADKRWLLRRDGVRLYIEGTLTALKDRYSEKITGYLKVMRDDTERALALIELERSERNYRFLAESIPEVVWTARPDGSIDYYNQHWYQFTGLTREQSEGWAWQDALHPDDSDDCVSKWKQSVQTGEPLDMECRFRRADGSYCFHIRRAVAQKDSEGRLLKWFGTCTDIEAQKQSERALRQAAKLESIGVLAGGVAHDFNNLLTGILGNTSIALEMLSPTQPVRGILEAAMRAGKSAADLTQQLLAYAGKGRFVFGPVNLSGVIQEISGLIETSIPRTVQLRLDLAGHLPLIEADCNQMQQIVMNLIINGAEAMGTSPGTVLVTTRAQDIDENYIHSTFDPGEIGPGRYVAVEVHDTGCGMDEATIAKIFDPFFTTKFTGRGLGLAAVLGIVRSHKGGIKVHSTPGKGSTFKLLFPALASVAKEPAVLPEQKHVTGTGTVLVIDDQAGVRDVARGALQLYGYSVLTADNGLQGVELFREWQDDVEVVILDLAMPVMDGEEALWHLREIRPGVKVILSSGYSEIDATRRFSGKGLAGFLQKPYTARKLGETVRQALSAGKSASAGTP
jgi:two-component system cell cycle sensor histidine kinase/response regulator CckA